MDIQVSESSVEIRNVKSDEDPFVCCRVVCQIEGVQYAGPAYVKEARWGEKKET
jgi:hypothetical protein